MELVAEVTIPNSPSSRQYIIDREELLHSFSFKLISDKLFVYLVIKLSFDSLNPSIDVPSFCESWEITEAQFTTAVAQLHKKGVLQPVARQLQLELF